MTRVYEEIVDFIAGGVSPMDVAAWQPSDQVRARLAALLEREKAGALSPDERAELDHYAEIEHLIRLAKARARGHSSNE